MNNSGKSHGCLIAIIVVLVLIIIVLAAVFVLVFLNKPDMPDIDEFISEVESTERTTDNDSSITDIINIQPDGGGVSEIIIELTNADLTALANDMVDSSEDIPIEDVLFNCNADETIDVTAVVTDLTVFADNPDIPGFVKSLLGTANGKRLYATVYIDYLGDNDFDIRIENIMIEKMNIPFVESIFAPMADNIEDTLKDQIESNENFELTDFNVLEDKIILKGLYSE